MANDPGCVIITGAGTGIGKACAELLARKGYPTVLAGRRREPLEAAAKAIDGETAVVPTDVAKPQSCQSLVASAMERFGAVDGLVNNAGWSPLEAIGAGTPETAQDIFAVNALGTVYLTQAAWDHLVASGQAGRRPCVVNISSYATVDPFPGLGVYAAAKGAVNVFSRACANEGAKHGVRAFAVAPGAVETELLRSIFDDEQLPTEATLAPEDVARVVAACIVGDRDDENGGTILVPSPGGVSDA
ncbi:MAG: SDR family oxidoreductase [Planctomycetota bacterium]